MESKFEIFLSSMKYIFEGVQNKGIWRRSATPNYTECSKSQILFTTLIGLSQFTLNWTGHVIHINNSNIPKEIVLATVLNSRRRGRIRLRWIYVVEEDCLVLKTKNWRTLAASTGGWERLVENVLAHHP
ncbi:hypothetical protein TNCV_2963691 [Trichonephila clavipes]|nr:hypothetical protein TNCV_2963691 [Trichonephila clavipes]